MNDTARQTVTKMTANVAIAFAGAVVRKLDVRRTIVAKNPTDQSDLDVLKLNGPAKGKKTGI